MDLILGIDPSMTSTGVIGLHPCDDGREPLKVVARILKCKAEDHLERACQQAGDLELILKEHRPRFCVMEGYAYANRFTIVAMVVIGTILRLKLRQHHVKIVEVAPAALKKFVAGKGNVKKDQMRLEAYKLWGVEYKEHDLVDAYGIARLGIAGLGIDPMIDSYGKARHEAVRDMGNKLKAEKLLT